MSTLPRPARLAWALAGLTVTAGVAHTVLALMSTEPLTTEFGLSAFPIITLGSVLGALVGAFIAVRHPRSPIGWLFLVGQLGNAIGLVAGSYAWLVLEDGELGPRWTGQLAGLVGLAMGAVWTLTVLAIAFLIFPDGRLPSRRWRPALNALVLLGVANVVAPFLLVPLDDVIVSGDGPELSSTAEAVTAALELTQLALIGMALGNLVLRQRRSRGVVRQQIRWLSASAAALVASVLFLLAVQIVKPTGFPLWLGAVPLYVSYMAVPLAAGVAILRYRLYDIDVVVSRAIILTVSTLVVAAGYTVLVVLVGGIMPARVSDAFWPSLLATAAVALAFQPLRLRIVRLADRLVFGARAAPYEALADFGRSLAQAPGPDDLLRGVAQAVSDATGARRVTAVLELPGGGEVSAAWPLTGGDGADRQPAAFAVTDRGERLGRVEVVAPPGRPLRASEHGLVERLLAQSALAVRNLRLETELAGNVAELDRRTTELADSRRRLVVARDEEKARLATALQRSVLPHLTPLPRRLVEAAAEVGRAVAPGVDLQAERDAATAALDELRRLVRGTREVQGQRAASDQAASSESGPNADLVT